MVRGLVGRRLPRVDDPRFLRGDARFVDDITLPGMAHAAIVRSPYPHGELGGLDRSGLSVPVDLALGPQEIRKLDAKVGVYWLVPGQRQDSHALVGDRVRFVGEPIGVVVAGSRAIAEDGAEDLIAEIEPLDAVADVRAATAAGAPLLYPEWGSNVAAHLEVGDTEDLADAAFEAADRICRTELETGRLYGAPIEDRGIVAAPDPVTGGLSVWLSCQAPHMVKDMLATTLGIAHTSLRVIAPDVGGGFGLKDHIHEDELLVCLAALRLGRPVKWICARSESLLSTNHARDERWEVELAYDLDGTLRGLRVHGLRAAGAYLSLFGPGPLASMMAVLPGPYRWDAVRATGEVVVTNQAPTAAYRGFGQPQAVFVRERAVDLVAGELEMDPVELRLQNMIGTDELPYTTRTHLEYESGDYPAALRRASDVIAAGDPPSDDGRARGIGFSSYVEMCAIGPTAGSRLVGVRIGSYETATVSMENDASVRIAVGTSSHGQGHDTTYAQLAADHLGVPIDRIKIVQSDTATTPYSPYGTAASRSIALAGGAIVRASEAMGDRLRAIAAEMLEASADDVVLEDGAARVAGTDRSLPLEEVTAAGLRGYPRPDGQLPGLSETFVHDPPNPSFSYATHACRVAVDTETGAVEVERFVVVHDCGTMVNPMIVEGQIHGGVAQGIGAALLEEMAYDDAGQPMSTTFMDYLLPTADVVPSIEIEHLVHPSPFIPGGMKGMGEGGTIGAPAAVVNAIAAAVPGVATRITATPVTPQGLQELLREG
jgi:aerobic carbon-monoxide dehydrogenase large subunit